MAITIYDLCNSMTVQGKVRISAFDDNCINECIVFEGETDDLNGIYYAAYEDCDINYMFCADGVMHIEIEAPKYVLVREEYADEWTGGNYDDPDDHEVVIDFWELQNYAESWGKTVEELLNQCEAY